MLFPVRLLPLLAGVCASALVAAAAPTVLFTDIDAGPKSGGPGNHGAPISLFGRGFGATRGESKVTIGGVEVASYLAWGQNNAAHAALDMIIVQPGAAVSGGAIVVTVNSEVSTGDFSFTPNSGRILYISPNGSDGGSCSEQSPCRSMLETFGNKAKPGDMVLARGGTYSEGEIWLRAETSGTVNARKVFKNYPGETPIFSNKERPIYADASFQTFSGLNLRNGKAMGIMEHLENINATARGIWIINSTNIGPIEYEGFGTHGSDHILAGNYVDVKDSSQGTQGHCYYISFGDNVKLLYNFGMGAPGYGIHIYDQPRQNRDYRRVISNLLIEGNVLTRSTKRAGMMIKLDDHGYGAPYGNLMENVIVRNNVVYKNAQIGIVAGGGTAETRGLKIYNNTVVENGMLGIYLGKSDAKLSGVEVKNNLIVQTDKSNCNDKECGSCCNWYPLSHIVAEADPAEWSTIENNGYFPGNPLINLMIGKTVRAWSEPRPITGSVTFANPAENDYHVVGSEAVDAGVPLTDVTRDFDGKARPAGSAPDLGAYETEGGTGPMPERPNKRKAELAVPPASNLPGDDKPNWPGYAIAGGTAALLALGWRQWTRRGHGIMVW